MHSSVVLYGRQYVALLHSSGVDILSCDVDRNELVQSLVVPLATRVSFCQRTGRLAIMEESVLRIYCHDFQGAISLSSTWTECKTVLIPSRCHTGGPVISFSFNYPICQVHVKGMMTLCCVESAKFENISDMVNIPNLVSGGSLSHLGGFIASLECGPGGAILLRVVDVSSIFDPNVNRSVTPEFVTIEVGSPGVIGSSGITSSLDLSSLEWRPGVDGDFEVLLTRTPGGIIKVWTVTHGKEHEVITAALHAVASAGIRAECLGSLHDTTPPEIQLVADLSPLYAGLSILSSVSVHNSPPYLGWVHQTLKPKNCKRLEPSALTALQSSDLWLSAVLSPSEHPLAPVWVCQLLHLRPKGRYHQYEAAFAGEPWAFRSPLDGLNAAPELGDVSGVCVKLISSSVFAQFTDSFGEFPGQVLTVSQFQPIAPGPGRPKISDLLTMGI